MVGLATAWVMMLSHGDVWQFIRASAFAVAGAYRSMPVPEATGYTVFGFVGLVRLVRSKKAEPTTVAERVKSCAACHFFNPKLKTCGTPGTVDRNGHPVGCWCFLPLVSKFQDKGCWKSIALNIPAPNGW